MCLSQQHRKSKAHSGASSLLTASRFLFLEETMCSFRAVLSSWGTCSRSHSCWILSLRLSHVDSLSAFTSCSCRINWSGQKQPQCCVQRAIFNTSQHLENSQFDLSLKLKLNLIMQKHLAWQSSSLRAVMLSRDRQKESSSSQTTSFSKLLSGMWSSSSMCNVICFLSSMNSACRFACQQTTPLVQETSQLSEITTHTRTHEALTSPAKQKLSNRILNWGKNK